MAFDLKLSKKLSELIEGRNDFYQQKMFGGVGFLLKGNMCFAVWKDMLILRLGDEQAQKALKRKNTKPFDITGRPMRGWVMVKPEGMKTKAALDGWIHQAINYVGQLPRK